MTPLEIEVLLKAHYCAEYHPSDASPAEEEAIRRLLCNDLLQHMQTKGSYTTSLRGQAHVAQLCGLEWPTQAWIGADGKVIEI
jgi:hypothetical protein